MDSMMAIRAYLRGGPERLVYERAPRPRPSAGEVLVAVHAAAITFAELDWHLSWTTRDGTDRTPMIPAHEVSGVVAALGSDVSDVAVGGEVYALVDFDRDGAAAEFVGVYAVQLAAWLGARVVATDLPEHEHMVRKLGAADFIDVTIERFDELLSGIDVVLDTQGGATHDRSYRVLRPGGPDHARRPADPAARRGARGRREVLRGAPGPHSIATARRYGRRQRAQSGT